MIFQCKHCKEEIEVDDSWSGLPGSCPHCNRKVTIPGKRKPTPPSPAILYLSVGLVAAFFMPWFQLFGFAVSGYQIGRFGSYGNYAWVIPILAGATIAVTLQKQNNRFLGALTGIIPLLAIAYGLVRLSSEGGPSARDGVIEVLKHVMSVGGYLTVICSVGLLLAAATKHEPKLDP